MTTIILEKRATDTMAYIEGKRVMWDCGKTSDEAIGRLVRTHGPRLGIRIQDPPVKVERDAVDLGIGAVPR